MTNDGLSESHPANPASDATNAAITNNFNRVSASLNLVPFIGPLPNAFKFR